MIRERRYLCAGTSARTLFRRKVGVRHSFSAYLRSASEKRSRALIPHNSAGRKYGEGVCFGANYTLVGIGDRPTGSCVVLYPCLCPPLAFLGVKYAAGRGRFPNGRKTGAGDDRTSDRWKKVRVL